MRCRGKWDREVERHDGSPGVQRKVKILLRKMRYDFDSAD